MKTQATLDREAQEALVKQEQHMLFMRYMVVIGKLSDGSDMALKANAAVYGECATCVRGRPQYAYCEECTFMMHADGMRAEYDERPWNDPLDEDEHWIK